MCKPHIFSSSERWVCLFLRSLRRRRRNGETLRATRLPSLEPYLSICSPIILAPTRSIILGRIHTHAYHSRLTISLLSAQLCSRVAKRELIHNYLYHCSLLLFVAWGFCRNHRILDLGAFRALVERQLIAADDFVTIDTSKRSTTTAHFTDVTRVQRYYKEHSKHNVSQQLDGIVRGMLMRAPCGRVRHVWHVF